MNLLPKAPPPHRPADSVKPEAGVTLVELSIVLVIIALVVGGVLAGQALTEQAKLRKIINEIDNYKKAATTFKLKYNYLPGDLPNADNFFPTECNVNPNRCRGNGDGQVIRLDTIPGCKEDVRFWHVIYWAGLASVEPASTWNLTCNSNPPNSAVPMIAGDSQLVPRIYAPGDFADPAGTWWRGYPSSNHSLILNGDYGERIGTITTINAKSINAKLDDGKPMTGMVQGEHTVTSVGADRRCKTTNIISTTDYDIAYTERDHSCQLRFNMGF